MQCKCGASTLDEEHIVKSRKTASAWMWGRAEDVKLPLTIRRDVCPGCGRQRTRIYDCDHVLLEKRG